jgi:hypothetical protein
MDEIKNTSSDLFYYFHPRLFGHENEKGYSFSFVGFIAQDMSRLNEPGRPAPHERYNERFRARYGAINMSKLHRDLEAALAKAVKDE